MAVLAYKLDIFAAATKFATRFFSEALKKIVTYFRLYESFSYFSGIDYQKNTVCEKHI